MRFKRACIAKAETRRRVGEPQALHRLLTNAFNSAADVISVNLPAWMSVSPFAISALTVIFPI
jgi:hypothetical protein